jgi:hypothetical protein
MAQRCRIRMPKKEGVIMKLSFENLGALDHGELELAELSILCGHNNTGKTSVTYALYCLLQAWRSLMRIDLQVELHTLSQKGVVQIDVDAKIVQAWPAISQQVLTDLAQMLPTMMASHAALFAHTRLDWQVSIDDQWQRDAFRQELRNGQGNLLIGMSKPANSPVLEISATNLSKELIGSHGIHDFLSDALVNLVLTNTMPDVFIASSERTGASLFHRDLAQSHLFGYGTNVLHQERIPYGAVQKKGYPRPVDDNVRFTHALPANDQDRGPLAQAHPELLDAFAIIAGGQYATNGAGVTWFQPANTELKLGLAETSSAVRSLLIIWYWLKYQARIGSMLMIDEPELNLHPDNQRRFARFLARLVNVGVRVFITTHSDTIIREFNTLLMLSRNLPHYADVRKKHGYAQAECLQVAQVVLYATGDVKCDTDAVKAKRARATLIKVTPDPQLGLDVQTFDQTIIAMNQMQDEIRYGAE